MDAAQRDEILTRYREHCRSDSRRSPPAGPAVAAVIQLPAARRPELEQSPTAREIEVLQLVSDGLVNREIGDRLFLSEETVKSHVRHMLANFRRGQEPTPSPLASGVGS